MSPDVIIETRNLTKVYRDFWGRPKVQALKALDLKVYRGEIFGVLGPNGSGKTTTIKLLLGLLFPTEGDAFIFGEPTTNVAKNERIGYLPEESYLYKFLNAEETLHFYGRLFKISSAERAKRVNRLIEMVGLNAAKHRQLREYSKGMQRRIGLARDVGRRFYLQLQFVGHRFQAVALLVDRVVEDVGQFGKFLRHQLRFDGL